jgi:hypothetical protein
MKETYDIYIFKSIPFDTLAGQDDSRLSEKVF